jgi:hypothetical protein
MEDAVVVVLDPTNRPAVSAKGGFEMMVEVWSRTELRHRQV